MILPSEFEQLVAEIKAANPETLYPRLTMGGAMRILEARRLMAFEPMPVVREIKGKRLRIAILTKGLRK